MKYLKNSMLALVVILLALNISKAQKLESDRLVYEWTNMKNMVVNSAKAMPAEHYEYVPTDGLRSFADQVKHITTSNRFFVGSLAGEDNKAANQKTIQEVKGKEAIIADLEQSFDYVIATLPKIKGFDDQVDMFGQKLSRIEVLMFTEHHLHREHGKITIYMRMKGVAPAKSTSWLL